MQLSKVIIWQLLAFRGRDVFRSSCSFSSCWAAFGTTALRWPSSSTSNLGWLPAMARSGLELRPELSSRLAGKLRTLSLPWMAVQETRSCFGRCGCALAFDPLTESSWNLRTAGGHRGSMRYGFWTAAGEEPSHLCLGPSCPATPGTRCGPPVWSSHSGMIRLILSWHWTAMLAMRFWCGLCVRNLLKVTKSGCVWKMQARERRVLWRLSASAGAIQGSQRSDVWKKGPSQARSVAMPDRLGVGRRKKKATRRKTNAERRKKKAQRRKTPRKKTESSSHLLKCSKKEDAAEWGAVAGGGCLRCDGGCGPAGWFGVVECHADA